MSKISILKFENHKVPEFKEVKGKDFVYYGVDNQYPEFLTELATRSAKHSAILSSKVNYIYGKGLNVVSAGVSLIERAKAEVFIKQFDVDGFGRRMVSDFEWFNGFFIEPIFNKAKTKIVSINYIPFSKMRVSADEKKYFYSNDWRLSQKQSPEKTGYKEFDPFDFNNPKPNTVFYYKILSPRNSKDKNVYPMPEYVGAVTSIETDIEIANYHRNCVKSNFSIGTIINFNNGNPDDLAKQEIEDSLKEKFTGTDAADSILITFNDSAEKAPTITSFAPNELDKKFIEIGKRVEQDILTGHKLTSPMLAGIKTEGQLGGRSEIIDAYELFYNTYIDVRQNYLEEVIKKFASLFGITCKIEFEDIKAINRAVPDSIYEKAYNLYGAEQLLEILRFPKVKKNIAMSSDVNIFKKYGSKINGVVVKETPIFDTENFDFEKHEKDFFISFKKTLSVDEDKIMKILKSDSLTPTSDIAKSIGVSEKEVNKIISSLEDEGYLDVLSEDIVVNDLGEDVLNGDNRKGNYEIKYRYGWRPDVKNKDLDNSRDFCKDMIEDANSGRAYSRSDIENMTNDLGSNVWEFRGGWWNKNGANVPYCRHIWSSILIKIK
jgi:hypothetical protein